MGSDNCVICWCDVMVGDIVGGFVGCVDYILFVYWDVLWGIGG